MQQTASRICSRQALTLLTLQVTSRQQEVSHYQSSTAHRKTTSVTNQKVKAPAACFKLLMALSCQPGSARPLAFVGAPQSGPHEPAAGDMRNYLRAYVMVMVYDRTWLLPAIQRQPRMDGMNMNNPGHINMQLLTSNFHGGLMQKPTGMDCKEKVCALQDHAC